MDAHATPARPGRRHATLGPFAIAFFVISASGPLVAIAGGLPVAMLFGNGPGLPAMFVLATAVLLVFATAYTAMALDVPEAGAFYAFAARGLGRRWAGATGLLALLGYSAMQISLYGLFGAAARGLLLPLLEPALPWWLPALAAWGSIALLGYRQVDLSARLLGLLVAGEYLAVLALGFCIVRAGGAEGIDARPFTPALALAGAPAVALTMCFACFVGFEAAALYSEEARNPARSVPLATWGSVLLIGGFYGFAAWAVVTGLGAGATLDALRALPDPTELLFVLAERYMGGAMPALLRALYLTSAYASLLAFHNAVARYLFAMGRDRLLPARLGRIHARHGSPHAGSLAQSGSALLAVGLFALAGADPVLTLFTLLSALGTLGIIVLMGVAALATLCHFARARPRRPVVLASAALSLASFAAIATLATVHFDVLAGGSDGPGARLPWLLPLAMLAGAALARRPPPQRAGAR
ncbi:APC family permease [Derxia lacustris]|uniref:APC family permease n=1 Tax=Derxia lacustris TaxID=764842 RepID=UPI000A1768D2|nr:APC family permease [Derxia lacustris]